MALRSDLDTEVKDIFSSRWDVQATDGVPAPEDLRLDQNHAKDLKAATVLYADLDGSTKMVDAHPWEFSAEIYKAYLKCAAAIIRSEGGAVTAYDGDRVMAIFTGSTKNTSAVRTALKIKYAISHIIVPAMKAQYRETNFELKHVVGIDTAQLRAARIGVRGDNDLVWVGRAANYAAKLTSFSTKATWITKSVYDSILKEAKYSNGVDMWTSYKWEAMNNITIYGSDYHWTVA